MKLAKHVFFFGLLGTFSATVSAERFVVEAPVVSVSPVVRTVTDRIPSQSCWDERVRVRSHGGYHAKTPSVLGAVIGGAAGGALGDNTGHQGVIATAGALLGAAVGHDVSHKRSGRTTYVTERRCETNYELSEREEVVGYRVAYEYAGAVHHTQTKYRPGPTIEVGVILDPIEK